MFDEFFEKKLPIKPENASQERINSIKAAVLTGIRENSDESDFKVCEESEVTPMKKRSMARPFIIAAAVAAMSTMSLVSANTLPDIASSGSMSDKALTDSVSDEKLTDTVPNDESTGRVLDIVPDDELTDPVLEDELTGPVPGVVPADDELTDGAVEYFSVFVIDENGTAHVIARDYIEWTENEAGGFDICYDATPEIFNEMRDYFDVGIPYAAFDVIIEDDFSSGDEEANVEDIKVDEGTEDWI